MELSTIKKTSTKDVIIDLISNIGMYLILFITSTLIYVSISQFFNCAIKPYTIIITLIINSFLFFALKRKEKDYIKLFLSILISIVIIIALIIFAGKTYDLTFDGNTYHKYAVGSLKNGWNPIYESSYDFAEKNNFYPSEILSLWIDHYAKATWTFGAVVYAFTSDIESGKVMTLLIITAFMCILTAYLSKRYLKLWQSIIVALALGLNPIVCSQLFSYYVDGTLAIIIYLLVLFLVIITDNKYKINSIEKYLGLFCSIVICINIKFTGLLFSGIFSILFYIYWLIVAYKEGNLKTKFIQNSAFFAVTLVVSLFLVGYSTYVKNYVDNKNPLYPLFGENKVDIITANQPIPFRDKNIFQKLIYSLFGEVNNTSYCEDEQLKLKIPFTYSDKELEQFTAPDVRVSGFGPLYSGILIISVGILGVGLFKLLKAKNTESIIIILILLSTLITILMMSESWWARYAPQLYLITGLALILVFKYFNNISYNKNKEKKGILIKLTYMLGSLILIGVIALNSWFTLNFEGKNIDKFKEVSTSLYVLSQVSKDSTCEVRLANNEYKGLIFNLMDKGIDFKINEELESTNYAYNYMIIY